MKKFSLFALIFALFFGACFNGSGVLEMPRISFSAPISDAKHFITLSVYDLRSKPNIIGSVKNSDLSVNAKVSPSEPLASWLRAALVRKLSQNQISVKASKDEASANVEIKIREFYANIDSIGQNNMHGNFALEIIIKKQQNSTTTLKHTQPMSDFALMPAMSSLEPFIKELLLDMLARSAKEIANNL